MDTHDRRTVPMISKCFKNRWLAYAALTLTLIWVISLAHQSGAVHDVVATTTSALKHSYYTHISSSASESTTSEEQEKDTSLEPAIIPRKIWHILFPNNGAVTDQQVSFLGDWVKSAPGYTYTLLGAGGGTALVRHHYGAASDELRVFEQLTNPALKSDLLRYLILAAEGGYYGDVDTQPLVPLEDWVAPPGLRARARLIIAPEADGFLDQQSGHRGRGDGGLLQFGQWAIAAAPGHPVLTRMVSRCLAKLHALAEEEGTTLDKVHPDNIGVLNTTGPIQWTDVIWEHLYDVGEEAGVRGKADLGRLFEPKLVGDVLVLPITAFRAPTVDEVAYFEGKEGDRRLLAHHMLGTWRGWSPPGE
ncbi:hypothetical protein BKA67DRAFT_244661 [Truncatella angustata]|uniref:Initiation-specific alpha-1,6-mannosyltransferase n=1 Tax=Truncatella angustata TaxID=152316 RepID=A0A9P9A042_9PEZI|nr:uncharacterized protein BKA67DRAFT_244661 [Truncatella angustata]KAH6655644.1 hypothetical protein BKA67DRAFT_244661 [Truncatella angustata]KAH8200840.1 hypothetical protein TruAng_004999 [Truncatella angustata]